MADESTEELIEEVKENLTETDKDELSDWGAAMEEQLAAEEKVKEAAQPEIQASGADVFDQFVNAPKANATSSSHQHDIDFILDIPVQLTVELGRTKIAIKNLLQLAQGSVVELDGLAGEPMHVLVNGCIVAQGEVVVVNDKFGIRLTDIITPSERIRKLNK